ncbi:ChrR family anti-sigma-E factor [Vibrio sp. Of7-15]|uniref:ChrR family anti-sigma-E factor n=1 Tax=Vibrio sp. Of7-15 TaxID=2724879 RepID=UPI001EF2B17F|nr:ChrR family anti-sigma-E factor [Vibrio sp. Of7-15]MCG7497872.1 ChrR family anti-sigma-E factor [Vibrio sp. Of7-15]
MINHHPSRAVLKEFAKGNLPLSVSIIVASHVEMCSECQKLVQLYTEYAALEAFGIETESLNREFFECPDNRVTNEEHNEQLDEELEDVLDSIIVQPAEARSLVSTRVIEVEIAAQNTKVALPRALNTIPLTEWQGVGKISRSRLGVEDDKRRMSLLCIDKNGKVPSHTHKGDEITLLLHGSFEDEMGTYQAGDFMWLNSAHTHNPTTYEGCICLTVSSDALHFTQGISQLFNPLGKLIY